MWEISGIVQKRDVLNKKIKYGSIQLKNEPYNVL